MLMQKLYYKKQELKEIDLKWRSLSKDPKFMELMEQEQAQNVHKEEIWPICVY